MSDDLTVVGVDGIRRKFHQHYDVMDEVMRDPQGAFYAIQRQADRIEELEAKLEKNEALMQAGFAEYERRLAKAVEAMEFWLQAQEPDVDAAINLMQATLAELKGENRR